MDTLSYKTISVSKEAAREQKEWVVIDATDQVVGRLASYWLSRWSAFQHSCRTP